MAGGELWRVDQIVSAGPEEDNSCLTLSSKQKTMGAHLQEWLCPPGYWVTAWFPSSMGSLWNPVASSVQ